MTAQFYCFFVAGVKWNHCPQWTFFSSETVNARFWQKTHTKVRWNWDVANGCKCPFKTLKRNIQLSSFQIIVSEYHSEYHKTYKIQLYFQIPPEDTPSLRTSFTLQELSPNTAYQIRLCCAVYLSKYWSDWNEVIGFTAEDSKQYLIVYLGQRCQNMKLSHVYTSYPISWKEHKKRSITP